MVENKSDSSDNNTPVQRSPVQHEITQQLSEALIFQESVAFLFTPEFETEERVLHMCGTFLPQNFRSILILDLYGEFSAEHYDSWI